MLLTPILLSFLRSILETGGHSFACEGITIAPILSTLGTYLVASTLLGTHGVLLSAFTGSLLGAVIIQENNQRARTNWLTQYTAEQPPEVLHLYTHALGLITPV